MSTILSRIGFPALFCLMLCSLSGPVSADDYLFGNSTGAGTQTLAVTLSNGGFFTVDTLTSEITPGLRNQGWWSPTASNILGGDNYITGKYFGDNYRNFFTFNLAALSPGVHVTSATLFLTPYTVYSDTGRTNIPYILGGVSVDPATLNTRTGPSPSIYHALGSGVRYGFFSVPINSSPSAGITIDTSSVIPFTLNQHALNDIQSHAGGYFSIAGGAPVPEMNTLLLLGVLFAVSGLVCSRRRHARSQ